MDDVIIIGAGPAGSMTAKLLAEQGCRVRLLEAGVFPKRKPCGESLNPGAVAALARAGVPVQQLLQTGGTWEGSIVRGWSLGSGKIELQASFPAGRYGVCCRRELLDERLVRTACEAGAVLEERARVDGLLRDEQDRVTGVYGRFTHIGAPFALQARLVVGADGLRSAAARSAGLGAAGKLRKAAFTARVGHAEGLADRVELHVEPQLVIGVAPLGGGLANMTVAMPGRTAAAAARDKAAFMLQAASRSPRLAAKLAHAKIEGEVLASGPFDRPVKAAAVPGLVLVGDAAGYYDPLTGQGIYRAVRSAEMAALRIMEALAGGFRQPLQQYERERQAAFAPGLRLQRLIEWGSRNPYLWHSAIRGLVSSPRLSGKLASWIGDC
ncbi:NAD(P)/FAD-dependent oxidoreductase [Paenibacillus protaetiae]|uniref:NAD(P)/FAD-dependent oxidoreductase n=1 Tax=Paenibacillus protaetiae TaxID=2509456 RepID=A0A4P6EUC1_9BACL|nr:NAD(P)/FAD-dependent oxidoreductase [Paenibacillus protaetiae]QAY66075.1 NAD(P)/FAD-dependent oxidoreductase [Paenibacillus protaetiae]